MTQNSSAAAERLYAIAHRSATSDGISRAVRMEDSTLNPKLILHALQVPLVKDKDVGPCRLQRRHFAVKGLGRVNVVTNPLRMSDSRSFAIMGQNKSYIVLKRALTALISPSEVDRIWLWVYYNKIPIYPMFYLLKGEL